MSGFNSYKVLAEDSWRDYVGYFRDGDPYLKQFEDGGEVTLDYVINEWLWWNKGWRACFSQFEIFLKVVTFIVEDYRQRGTLPIVVYKASGDRKKKKYRLTAVLDDKHGMPTIFDSDNFQAAVTTAD